MLIKRNIRPLKKYGQKKQNIFFALVIILAISFTSCLKKVTNEDLVRNLINNYAKGNLADYQSFEIIEISNVDSLFTQLINQIEILQYADEYKNTQLNIQKAKEQLTKVNNYLNETRPYLEQAKDNAGMAALRINEFLGYDSYGSKKIGPTLNSISNYNRAEREYKRISNYIKEAQKIHRDLTEQINDLYNNEAIIKDNVKRFCTDFNPTYIGKHVLLKCRLKNEQGDMQIGVYDIILNDSLTQIVSITDTIKRSINLDMHDFISFCHD